MFSSINFLTKSTIALVAVATLALFPQPSDAEQVPDAFEGESVGCRALGAAVAVASVHPAVRSASETTQLASLAAASVAGGEAGAYSCSDGMDRLIEYYSGWDVDYDEFIEQECDGDPFGCTDPLLNPVNHFPTPNACSSYIVCSNAFLDNSASVSVSGFIGSLDSLGVALNMGSWNIQRPGPNPGFEPLSDNFMSSNVSVWTESHWDQLADWAEAALEAGMPDEEVAEFVEQQVEILEDIATDDGSGGGGTSPGPSPEPGFGVQCWACDGNQTPDPVYPEDVEMPNSVGHFYSIVGVAIQSAGAIKTGGAFIIAGQLIIWINDEDDDDIGDDDQR